MYTKNTLTNARLAYLRLSQVFDVEPSEFPTNESFETFYRIILVKLGLALEKTTI